MLRTINEPALKTSLVVNHWQYMPKRSTKAFRYGKSKFTITIKRFSYIKKQITYKQYVIFELFSTLIYKYGHFEKTFGMYFKNYT